MEGNREIGVVIDGRITMDTYVLLIKGTGMKSSHTKVAYPQKNLQNW